MNRCIPMLNGKLYLGGTKVGVAQGYVRWYLELIQNISPCSGDKALDLSRMDSTWHSRGTISAFASTNHHRSDTALETTSKLNGSKHQPLTHPGSVSHNCELISAGLSPCWSPMWSRRLFVRSWLVSLPCLGLAGTTGDLALLSMVTCPWQASWVEAGVQVNQRMPARTETASSGQFSQSRKKYYRSSLKLKPGGGGE